MADDLSGSREPDIAVRTLHQVLPWLVLVALLAVGVVLWSGFQTALRSAPPIGAPGASSVASSSVEPSVSAVPTGTIAVTRIDGVTLRAAGNPTADVLLTLKKGTTLQVLGRTDAWLRVRDPVGHIGWTPNTTKTVEVRKK
jgi:hypothetical protein